jgi:hypothetical protein
MPKEESCEELREQLIVRRRDPGRIFSRTHRRRLVFDAAAVAATAAKLERGGATLQDPAYRFPDTTKALAGVAPSYVSK